MMGLSHTCMQRLTLAGLTTGYHPRRRQWMLMRLRGERKAVPLVYFRDYRALLSHVTKLVAAQ